MVTVTAPAQTVPWWRRLGRPGIVAAILLGWIVFGTALHGRHTLSLAVSEQTALHDQFSSFYRWIDTNRYSNPFFTGFLEAVRSGIDALTTFLRELISQPSAGRPVPVIGWLGVVALATLAAYAFGNGRVAVLTAAGFVSLGLLGWWQESMDTLAQTLAAVGICLLVGIPLGVLVGLSRRAQQAVTPVLDVMQAMPPLVYLLPLTLFFLIGPTVAVITTIIFAAPPVIRLTALGVRRADAAAVEASRSLGSTRWQRLRTVRLPLARRTIVVGVNQTIMCALSMVTIAGIIGGPGLGAVIIGALSALDMNRMFTSGLAIVIIGVVLDRVTTAASERQRAGARPAAVRARRIVLIVGGAATLVAVYLSNTYLRFSVFPGGSPGGAIGDPLGNAAEAVSDWAKANLFVVTDAILKAVSYGLLNPLQGLLAQSPWYVVCAAILGLVWTIAGARSVVLAAVCLALLLASGLWEASMVTLTSALVATLIVVALGVLFGVVLAHNRRTDLVLRPVLDAAQVMPPFVYLVPVLGLFLPTRLTAIIAAVVFAAPVATKIVADGVRAVPATVVEAATASGSSRWQVIRKVELPMARHAIVLAANQGLIYVLSMVVIGGLVGGGALGYLVVAGLAQSDVRGKGLAAGIAIVVLAVLLDRVTQAAARRTEESAQHSAGAVT